MGGRPNALMNITPILTRELHCRDFRRALLRQRFGAGATAGALLLALVALDFWFGGLNANRLAVLGLSTSRLVVFPALVGIAPFMVFVLGLHAGAALLSTERREGTLPLLLLTEVTGFDLVLGKLLQSIFTQGLIALAALPGLILPMLALGLGAKETCFLGLACLNLLFFSVAFGLFGAVFDDTRKAASWCLFLFLPVLCYSTPFSLLIPAGSIRDGMAALQWLNPCSPVAEAQSAAAGFQVARFWIHLLATHFVGWSFALLAGFILPWAVRWRAGFNAGRLSGPAWLRARSGTVRRRGRWLDLNPLFWLNSRDRWGGLLLWLWLLAPVIAWTWLAYLIWLVKALNVASIFVIAIGLSWVVVLFSSIPAHAARQLVADRINGTLELILCTPSTAEMIAGGIWLSLRRRFLPPFALVSLFSTVLMVAGYITFGFGGMLDPDDRPRWLFCWLTGITLTPLALYALCWMSMRRALFARNTGEASAIALLQVLGTIGFCGWSLALLTGFSNSPWLRALQLLVSIAILLQFARRARRRFLGELRSAAARALLNETKPAFSQASHQLLAIAGRWRAAASLAARFPRGNRA